MYPNKTKTTFLGFGYPNPYLAYIRIQYLYRFTKYNFFTIKTLGDLDEIKM